MKAGHLGPWFELYGEIATVKINDFSVFSVLFFAMLYGKPAKNVKKNNNNKRNDLNFPRYPTAASEIIRNYEFFLSPHSFPKVSLKYTYI